MSSFGSHPDNAPSPLAASMMRRGRQLVERPAADRDDAWHVEAFYLGDLPALASALLRSPMPPKAADA